MAECGAVCEHIHLPLQSGSTRILKAMRRTYSRERYLALVDKLRAAIPDLALTTDLIVGFPGETEEDFAETVEVVEEVGYDGAFTFVFSPRSGTEAASMPDQVPEEVKAERIERLIEVVQGARRPPERRACRPDRAGARRGPEPDRSRGAARPDAAEHDGQLQRGCRARCARRRPHRGLDVDDAARNAGSPRRSLTRSPDIRRATRAPFPIRLEAEGGPRRPRCHVHR